VRQKAAPLGWERKTRKRRKRENGLHEQIELVIIVIKVNKYVLLKNSISNLPKREDETN
jgi:hypothetical protein